MGCRRQGRVCPELRGCGPGPRGERLFLFCRARREQHRRLARDPQRPVHRRAEHPADGTREPDRLERQHPAERYPKALHAGSRQGVEDGVGGNATNTLILLHIPAGGKKAVGFSIPRDNWVNFADTLGTQQVGKIDQAYGVSLAAKESELRTQDPGISQNQIAYQGNEAGRAATVATVEQLTGVHIDHFAEINLDGFYELAKVLGGVEVCLNHSVPYDPNSGFYANKAGYQHLSAAMALAFVRQRDGLLNGDLDRTHRQQAFLDWSCSSCAPRACSAT